MKTRLFYLSILLPLFFGCEDKPVPVAETAFITAADVTVEEGSTEQIVASTNSSAPFTYVSADEAIATVSSEGIVTGVTPGYTTVTLSVAAVEGKFTDAEKTINVTVSAKETPPTPPEPDDDLDPEIKSGDIVLATNASVDKFLNDVLSNIVSKILITWQICNLCKDLLYLF